MYHVLRCLKMNHSHEDSRGQSQLIQETTRNMIRLDADVGLIKIGCFGRGIHSISMYNTLCFSQRLVTMPV